VPHHSFRKYEVVEIVKLSQAPKAYEGSSLNKRAPVLGDRGTIVEVLSAPKVDTCFVVECVEPDGGTAWLADFSAEELAPVADVSCRK